MGVRKDTTKTKNTWLAEYYLNDKRVRRWFATKGEALRFFNASQEDNSPFRQFLEEQTQRQSEKLSELIKLWFDLYGQSLKDGEGRYRKLKLIVDALGDPVAAKFSAEDFAEYRAKRLRGKINFRHKNNTPIKARTLNYELDILQAVFNELKRLKKWDGENPLSVLRPLKTDELELRFLRDNEILKLLDCCEQVEPLLKKAVLLCLATGARWGEAMALTPSSVIPYKVTFNKTKGGKNRSVPISPELYKMLDFSKKMLFDGVSHKHFEKAVKLSGITLRDNQLTHVLRHTFASHFMMNGGNILVLRDILGHSDISMTMVYAHFAPSHLETAVTLNPLANLSF